MPAFGSAYSDVEIASLANYVTARFGAQPSAVTAQDHRDAARAELAHNRLIFTQMKIKAVFQSSRSSGW